MTGVQTIQAALKSTANLPAWYLSDLSDSDLLIRPTPTSNHIAWQLGHLVSGESGLAQIIFPDAKYPKLPAGFKEQYTKENSSKDTGFLGKSTYLDMFAKARQTTIEIVGKLKDSDLDKPVSGPMAKFCAYLGRVADSRV